MKRITICLLTTMAMLMAGAQQTRYVISFTDKASNPYSLNHPEIYLSARAIDRRARYGIGIDSTDLPVTPRYIDSIRMAGSVSILNVSKWLNSVSIQTTDAAALTKINSFPFVRAVTGAGTRMNTAIQRQDKFAIETDSSNARLQKEARMMADFYNYGASFGQLHIHNGEFLHNIGLRGQSMLIGMLDGGFQNYLSVKALDSARKNGQILGTWDFVARDTSVNEDDAHGMECLSVILANIPGQFVGSAPKSAFYLFRTEDATTEYPIEEHNWVCGAERVDSIGGDLLSTSLGYTTFDPPFAAASHTYAEMNGNTTMAAIGADLAAKKGIIVVVSAGNEGTSSWHYISTPADADSVLSVGAVSDSGAVASFSSYGPSSDLQIKPDVASVGERAVVQFPNNSIGTNNGTSFAAPNIAGLAACLWQGFREFNNMRIINALRKSGSIASTPDNRIGYGIPDMKKAVMQLVKEFSSASASVANCKVNLAWSSKDMNAMQYEIERMLPGESGFTTIAKINGSGSLFSNHNYEYDDGLNDAVPPGAITYRIRQSIDTSVAARLADFLDTVVVSWDKTCLPGADNVVLQPNPARADLGVKITTVEAIQNLRIRIYNGKGQLVADLKKSKGIGTTFFTIPIRHLASGKYYVSVFTSEKRIATRELIKL